MGVIGWRKVPVDNSMLGKVPIDSEPITEQIFIRKNDDDNDNDNDNDDMSTRKFDRELTRVRKLCEDEVASMLGLESGFYINSLSPYVLILSLTKGN